MPVEGLAYVRAHYTGMKIVREHSPLRYEISDSNCPTFGEQGAIILDPNDAGKRKKSTRLTLFCPFTLKANSITPDAGEICKAVDRPKKRKIEGVKDEDAQVDIIKVVERIPEQDLDEERVNRLSRIITDNWRMRCKLGLASDLDVAAIVLTRMGKPVPEERLVVKLDESGEVRKTGKPPGDALLKAVNPDSKPGKVLAFYLGERKSVIEGMAEFGATRSALQSNLYGLWSTNGIGYELAADMVTIILPPGCEDPFAEPIAEGATKQEARVAEKTRGKPMQDSLLITELPAKGKRREVALACLNRQTPIVDIAKKLECSEGSVRSHLNDLHIKHGLGFEITPDGKAKILAPEGYADDSEKDPLA